MHDRRSFLRGLATLPLIGGGVTLIGNPTAAAVPVTDMLLQRYGLFLAIEAREALIECRERQQIADDPNRVASVRPRAEGMNWSPDNPWMRGLLEHPGGGPDRRRRGDQPAGAVTAGMAGQRREVLTSVAAGRLLSTRCRLELRTTSLELSLWEWWHALANGL